MLGIKINVDSSQLKDAKKHSDVLASQLENLQRLGDIEIDASGMPGLKNNLRDVEQHLRRMQSLTRTGLNIGLTPQQAQQAKMHFQQLVGGVTAFDQALQKAENRTAQLERRYIALMRAGRDTGTIEKQFAAADQRMQALQRQEARYRDVRMQARDSNDDLQAAASRDDGSKMASTIKKAIGFGMAAAGVGSITGLLLGFLGKSRATYLSSIGHTAALGGLGIRGGEGGGIGLGYGPVEYMELMQQMSKQSGAGGGLAISNTRLATAFGRAHGVDPHTVMGMYGSIYGATGSSTMGTGAIGMIESIKKGMEKARIPELLTMVTRNTGMTAQAMHGAGASEAQIGRAIALAGAAMNLGDSVSYKQYAKSAEFAKFAQSGYQGTGSMSGDIWLAKALGVYDGPMSLRKAYDINELKEKGPIGNPKAFNEVMAGLAGGTEEEQIASLTMRAPGWAPNNATARGLLGIYKSRMFEQIRDKGKSISQLKAGSDEEKALAAQYEASFSKLPGADKLQMEAKKEEQHLETGRKLNEALSAWEKFARKITDTILDAKMTQKLVDAINKLGDFLNNPGKKTMEALKESGKDLGGELLDYVTGGPLRRTLRNLLPNLGSGTEEFKKQMQDMAPPDGKTSFWNGFGTWATSMNTAHGSELVLPGGSVASRGIDFASASKQQQDKIYSNLKRGGIKAEYIPMIMEAAAEYGLDPYMVAGMLKQESNNNPNAISPKGAGGLMQLMPGTAKGLGVKNRFDPRENIFGGAKYLRQMMDKFKDPITALMAYNAGPGAVSSGKAYGYKETNDYVDKVTGNIKRFKGNDEGAPSQQDNIDYTLMIYELLRGRMSLSQAPTVEY